LSLTKCRDAGYFICHVFHISCLLSVQCSLFVRAIFSVLVCFSLIIKWKIYYFQQISCNGWQSCVCWAIFTYSHMIELSIVFSHLGYLRNCTGLFWRQISDVCIYCQTLHGKHACSNDATNVNCTQCIYLDQFVCKCAANVKMTVIFIKGSFIYTPERNTIL